MSEENKQLTEEEQLKELDVKAEEERLLAEAEKRANDPLATASLGYGLYSTKFRQGVDYLSSRGAKRLLKALVDKDLNDASYKLNKTEKVLLEIGNYALECKFLMMLETLNNARDLLQKAADPNVELTEQEKKDLEIINEGEKNV
jgi:hypothetical protein